MDEKRILRSGELAGLVGVSPDTLRHYERMKLLATPRRSPGNYRLYPREAVDRVRLIRRALAAGFSLPELANILKVRDTGGAPCRQVKRLLEEKLKEIDEEIREWREMRDNLRIALAEWDERLARAPKGKPARLLETLAGPLRHPKHLKLKGKTI